jgi:hypothetical protein
MSNLSPLSGQQLIALKDRISAGFNSSHWQELATITDSDNIVNGHSRLLRSLSWYDSDYDGNVLEVIKKIIASDSANLTIVLDYVNRKFPLKGGVEAPDPTITSAVVERAIADAEQLLMSSGATSGVDRMHTAMHGYLRAVCSVAGIEFVKDASKNSLLRVLREEHPALANSGPRSQDIEKVLKSMSTIMDALNPVRNNASVAHANAELLEAPEAMLCINAARTILHYLNAKFSGG